MSKKRQRAINTQKLGLTAECVSSSCCCNFALPIRHRWHCSGAFAIPPPSLPFRHRRHHCCRLPFCHRRSWHCCHSIAIVAANLLLLPISSTATHLPPLVIFEAIVAALIHCHHRCLSSIAANLPHSQSIAIVAALIHHHCHSRSTTAPDLLPLLPSRIPYRHHIYRCHCQQLPISPTLSVLHMSIHTRSRWEDLHGLFVL